MSMFDVFPDVDMLKKIVDERRSRCTWVPITESCIIINGKIIKPQDNDTKPVKKKKSFFIS